MAAPIAIPGAVWTAYRIAKFVYEVTTYISDKYEEHQTKMFGIDHTGGVEQYYACLR